MKKEKFYTELTEHLFYAVAEILPDEDTVHIYNIKKDKEYKFSKKEAEVFFSKHVFAYAGSGKPDFLEFSKLLKGKTLSKIYGLSIETKPNVLEHFVLSVYPKHKENKLFATLSYAQNKNETITFLSKKSAVNYNISDILYITYGNHCVRMHSTDKVENLFYISFNDAADTLLEHTNFIRSYKNCIVNLNKVDRIENGSFIMCNNDVISIPKRRFREIKQSYEEYRFYTEL